jgi:hypothetical protein
MTVRKKATVQGARRVTAGLDHLASLFQGNHESLGIPKKVAMDFARRCDILSDAIERGFGIKNAAFFNPAEIGKEVPGPLIMDSNNPFMNGEFTQERFNALAAKQMSGELASNAAAHVADPKLASLVAKEAAKLAFTVLKDHVAKQAKKSEEEEAKDEEPQKEAKKSEGDEDEKGEDKEVEKSAAVFGLFSTK